MYCVKCGVKLQDGVTSCPLCQTPVWNPEQRTAERAYPENLPAQERETNLPGLVAATLITVVSIVTLLIICLRLYGTLNWGVYAIGGFALFYILAILPGWFPYPRGEVFLPVDHVAAGLYVLWICIHTGGNWFLSFAFPLLGISCLLSTGLLCLLKYVKHGKPFILGGFCLALGASTLLIEFFEHITFGTVMFRWSLYTLAFLGLTGIFLLLAGFIPPLRHAMRRFFLY